MASLFHFSYMSESSEGASSDENDEFLAEEKKMLQESDGESESYDEGEYDGRKGEILYVCKTDEDTDEKKIYDQGIRET